MISDQLLPALKRQLTKLEKNLRATVERDPSQNVEPGPDAKTHLTALYEDAKTKQRTAATWSAWLDETVTQVAAAWLLGCVFLRFLEDNHLVETPWLAGAGDRGKLALDARTLYFRQAGHGHLSDTDYLTHCFREAARLPGLRDFFRAEHNPLWLLAPGGDAGAEILALWHATDPDTGALRFDFTDPQLATRFLGDLYQDLSEDARKRFALLQTPVFVEEFILDRTLEPALRDFGLREVRMIDPTCGSGHFLLGGFARLFARWQQAEPGTNPRVLVQRALDAVAGVDLNPFAAAIARFRLLIAALHACGSGPDGRILRLKDAPHFEEHIHVGVGDSLLHGAGGSVQTSFAGDPAFDHSFDSVFETEDAAQLRVILGRRYHAVVGNPPYITVKDKALNERYRLLWPSCHRKYSLAVPFFERFWTLAEPGDPREKTRAGYIGMITANSFMKREFGSKLVERFLPRWDLTHVIDTAGAYIPGHGTPTVIIFGKNQPPVAPTIRTVLGIRGEPATPEDPAQGLVWQAILRQVDDPGSESEWMSAADSARENFHHHPWSIGGGGAAELKEQLSANSAETLGKYAVELGIASVTGEDELYVFPCRADLRRLRIEKTRTLVTGDLVRDWEATAPMEAVWLYDDDLNLVKLSTLPNTARLFWSYRAAISQRKRFGTPMVERGLAWYEWQELYTDKLRSPLTITWAEIATHNHFVLDRGGKVFKNTAPVLKLKSDARLDDHLSLLGLLNSSMGCFWLKQVCFPKGGSGIGRGIQNEAWESRSAFNATQLADFPLPKEKPLALARELDRLALELQRFAPDAVLADASNHARAALDRARQQWTATLHRMVALQEELDWACYRAYGLLEFKISDLGFKISGSADLLAPTGPDGLPVFTTDEASAADKSEILNHKSEIPPLRPGERAFEILLARAVARGAVETTWFVRHAPSGMVCLAEPPATWPAGYLALFHRRCAAIEASKDLALIERPEYKRRWNVEPWDAQLARALRTWLLDRLETAAGGNPQIAQMNADSADEATFPPLRKSAQSADNSEPVLLSCARLADRVRLDADFLRVAELHAGRPDFDLTRLVTDLVRAESVPYLPHQRYRESGRRKRRDWEKTWDLQRREDAIDAEVSALPPAAKDAPALTPAEKHVLAQERKAREIGPIPVPPKYASADFAETSYWRLRGKLDVPKERFISYPAAERDTDPTPVILWAGFDHLQQAQALANYYTEMRETVGWPLPRLLPLLAGLLELIPWLKQWHNDVHPEYQQRMGDFYGDFVSDQARSLGTTLEKLRALAFDEV